MDFGYNINASQFRWKPIHLLIYIYLNSMCFINYASLKIFKNTNMLKNGTTCAITFFKITQKKTAFILFDYTYYQQELYSLDN